MQLQALDLTVFPHFMNSCLCRCHPEPSSPLSLVESILHSTSANSDCIPTVATGPYHCARHLQLQVLSYHPRPPLRPPLCCAGTHLVQRCAEPDSGIDPAGKLPVCKKAEGYFPVRPTPQPSSRRSRARVSWRCASGCVHVRVAAGHLHLSKTGASG